MAMVVTESCKGCKDKACVSVCPCDCFYEDAEMVYINPDECIDCYGCIPVCPVEAIFYQDDVPAQLRHYIELNVIRSKECPPAQLK